MKMHIKHEVTKEVLPRYLKANREEKKKILDEFSATTGYHRKSAIRKLKQLQMAPHIKESVAGAHTRKEKEYMTDMWKRLWNKYMKPWAASGQEEFILRFQ